MEMLREVSSASDVRSTPEQRRRRTRGPKFSRDDWIFYWECAYLRWRKSNTQTRRPRETAYTNRKEEESRYRYNGSPCLLKVSPSQLVIILPSFRCSWPWNYAYIFLTEDLILIRHAFPFKDMVLCRVDLIQKRANISLAASSMVIKFVKLMNSLTLSCPVILGFAAFAWFLSPNRF